MAEKRLIDAYALYKKFANDTPTITKGEQRYVATWRISDLIADAPTVDAVEVKHGRWSIVGAACVCSVCHNASIATYYYCPECGAKMDGERSVDE